MKYVLLLIVHSFVFSVIDPTNTNVILCGVGQNIEPHIDNLFASLDALSKCFNDYKIIIYENNSTDNTKSRLESWAKLDDKITFINETLSEEALALFPHRVDRIARARNIVLDEVLKSENDQFDIVIMLDLDLVFPLQPKWILNSFKIDQEWDVITANGMTHRSHYRDRFALRNQEYPFGPELINERFGIDIDKNRIVLYGQKDLIPVTSAFGGLAIYKKEAMKGARFTPTITKNYEALCKKALKNVTPHQRKLYEAQLKDDGIEGYEDLPLHFNNDLVCEHVTFFADMIANGHDKIFINPQMYYPY